MEQSFRCCTWLLFSSLMDVLPQDVGVKSPAGARVNVRTNSKCPETCLLRPSTPPPSPSHPRKQRRQKMETLLKDVWFAVNRLRGITISPFSFLPPPKQKAPPQMPLPHHFHFHCPAAVCCIKFVCSVLTNSCCFPFFLYVKCPNYAAEKLWLTLCDLCAE